MTSASVADELGKLGMLLVALKPHGFLKTFFGRNAKTKELANESSAVGK